MATDIDDERLSALSNDMRNVRRAIDALLEGDGRDACNIPGYIELADRHIALGRELGQAISRSERGLLAKARAIHPRDAAIRADYAITLALSLATDIVSVLS